MVDHGRPLNFGVHFWTNSFGDSPFSHPKSGENVPLRDDDFHRFSLWKLHKFKGFPCHISLPKGNVNMWTPTSPKKQGDLWNPYLFWHCSNIGPHTMVQEEPANPSCRNQHANKIGNLHLNSFGQPPPRLGVKRLGLVGLHSIYAPHSPRNPSIRTQEGFQTTKCLDGYENTIHIQLHLESLFSPF